MLTDESSRQVAGMLTDRDIATRCVALKHGGNCRVADHMTATLIHTVLTTDDAARVMQKMQAARVPVIHADGTLAGIVSQSDVLRYMGRRDPIAFERNGARILGVDVR